MPDWSRFSPSGFEYDFGGEELHGHRVTIDEAVQCFSNSFTVRKNKKYRDRFKLIGKTDQGRCLCIVFQLKPGRLVRIITGWDH
jgi:uncharacterized DUF497 family protein